GWAVLFPLVKALALVGESLGELALMPSRYVWFFTSGAVWRRLDPMHLWFLEYLLIFYAAALAAASVARWVPRSAVARVDRAFRAPLPTSLGLVVPAAVTGATLCLMQDGAVDDPSGFVPDARIAAAYVVFFAWGGLLGRNADLLPRLRRPP